MSDWTEAIGSIAAILTTASFLPQVLQTWRSRSAADLSWVWLVSFATGLALWLVYGLAKASLPLVAANGTTLTLVLLIALIKYRSPR